MSGRYQPSLHSLRRKRLISLDGTYTLKFRLQDFKHSNRNFNITRRFCFGFTLFIVGDLSCPGSDLELEADSSSFGARAQAVAQRWPKAGYFRLPSATPCLLSTKSELVLVDGVLAKQHFSFLTFVFFIPWRTFC